MSFCHNLCHICPIIIGSELYTICNIATYSQHIWSNWKYFGVKLTNQIPFSICFLISFLCSTAPAITFWGEINYYRNLYDRRLCIVYYIHFVSADSAGLTYLCSFVTAKARFWVIKPVVYLSTLFQYTFSSGNIFQMICCFKDCVYFIKMCGYAHVWKYLTFKHVRSDK